MSLVEKTWVRVLISLTAGGIGSELIFISTGDPNRPRKEGLDPVLWVIAIATYLLLTAYVQSKSPKK